MSLDTGYRVLGRLVHLAPSGDWPLSDREAGELGDRIRAAVVDLRRVLDDASRTERLLDNYARASRGEVPRV